MITEVEKEEFNEKSMMMILHAGDAREKISRALDMVLEDGFEDAEKLLIDAKSDIVKSHRIQTELIQKEAKGEEYYYSMLFSHAQDTLMTVQSEHNIAKKLVKIIGKIYVAS